MVPARSAAATQRSVAPLSAKRRSGPLMLIGGRFEDDNLALFQAIDRLSGSDMLVFSTASTAPEETGLSMVTDLREHGTRADWAELTWDNRAVLAADPALVRRIDRVGGVYFTGGDQSRILDSLKPNGTETPALQALRRLSRRGGLIAGSSAGAAMQCDPMIVSGSSLEALTIGLEDDPDRPGLTMGPGLGFFPWGIVDQHFIERGRIGRLVAALQASGERWGFGVDENTAMVVEDRTIRAVGETGFVVVDTGRARSSDDGRVLEDIRVSYIDAGDGFDLVTKRAVPDPARRLYHAGTRGYAAPARIVGDAFGSYTFHDAWLRLAQGAPRRYTRQGLTAGDATRGGAVSLTLIRKARTSRVWCDAGERFTLVNFLLTVHRDRHANDNRALVRPATDADVDSVADIATDEVADVVSSRYRGTCAEARRGLVISDDATERPPRNDRTLDAWFGDRPPSAEGDRLDCGGRGRTGDPSAARVLQDARRIRLSASDRRHVMARATHLGATSDLRHALDDALAVGTLVIAAGEAAPALGHEVIVQGDVRDALYRGVSPDAGVEGLVTGRGFGLVPGIVEIGVDRHGGLGRLIVACAERQVVGWALAGDGGFEIDTQSGRAIAFGRIAPLVVAVKPERVNATALRLDIRDALIRPIPPGENALLGAMPPATADGIAHEHHRVVALVESFAAHVGATREGGDGLSWSGGEVLLRLHPRRDGSATLDVSCHRDRVTHIPR